MTYPAHFKQFFAICKSIDKDILWNIKYEYIFEYLQKVIERKRAVS